MSPASGGSKAPGPHWGLCPQTPHKASRSALTIVEQLQLAPGPANPNAASVAVKSGAAGACMTWFVRKTDTHRQLRWKLDCKAIVVLGWCAVGAKADSFSYRWI